MNPNQNPISPTSPNVSPQMPITPPRPMMPPPVVNIPKPMMPTPPINIPKSSMPTGEHHSWTKVVITIVVLVAVVLVALFLQKNFSGTNKFTSENVQVQSAAKGLPSGFPTTTPVELNNIADSSTINYPDKKVTLYSVNYSSAIQFEQVYSEYMNYLAHNGYAVVSKTKTSAQAIIQAINKGDAMSVVITPQTGKTIVQIGYVVKE